jgi:hypothetical protein
MTTNAQTQARAFDLDRKHTVGQFLSNHPDALRAKKAHDNECKDFYDIGAHGRLRGGPLVPAMFPRARTR